MELWVGCVAGALEEATYRSKLTSAGFEAVDLEPTRIYRAADAKHFLEEAGLSDDATLAQIDGRIHERVRPRPQAGGGCEELFVDRRVARDQAASCGHRPVRLLTAQPSGGHAAIAKETVADLRVDDPGVFDDEHWQKVTSFKVLATDAR